MSETNLLGAEHIGTRIKAVREAQGMSRARLAECVGCVRATIFNIETGHSAPSVVLAQAIAKTLNVDLTWLIVGPASESAA